MCCACVMGTADGQGCGAGHQHLVAGDWLACPSGMRGAPDCAPLHLLALDSNALQPGRHTSCKCGCLGVGMGRSCGDAQHTSP